MPDLPAKIRAKLAPTYTAPWAMKQYRAALAAIVDLHKPVRGVGYGSSEPGGYGNIQPACAECGNVDEYAVPWPCPQLLMIAEKLGIEVDRG